MIALSQDPKMRFIMLVTAFLLVTLPAYAQQSDVERRAWVEKVIAAKLKAQAAAKAAQERYSAQPDVLKKQEEAKARADAARAAVRVKKK